MTKSTFRIIPIGLDKWAVEEKKTGSPNYEVIQSDFEAEGAAEEFIDKKIRVRKKIAQRTKDNPPRLYPDPKSNLSLVSSQDLPSSSNPKG